MGIEELRAAWNAQADQYNQWDELGLDEIVAFAQEVEREACAKVCDEFDFSKREEIGPPMTLPRYCAAAIRARSNAEVTGGPLAARPVD